MSQSQSQSQSQSSSVQAFELFGNAGQPPSFAIYEKPEVIDSFEHGIFTQTTTSHFGNHKDPKAKKNGFFDNMKNEESIFGDKKDDVQFTFLFTQNLSHPALNNVGLISLSTVTLTIKSMGPSWWHYSSTYIHALCDWVKGSSSVA